jgi:transposase
MRRGPQQAQTYLDTRSIAPFVLTNRIQSWGRPQKRIGLLTLFGEMLYIWVMEITEEQYRRIEACFPRQRGNVGISNLRVMNAILYVAEQGCKWRGLPRRFGNWHTIYTRMNRWAKAGVLDRIFVALQEQQIIHIKIEAMSTDSTVIKVHPDGTGALKKTARRPSESLVAVGPPRFIWLPRMLERP